MINYKKKKMTSQHNIIINYTLLIVYITYTFFFIFILSIWFIIFILLLIILFCDSCEWIYTFRNVQLIDIYEIKITKNII